MSFFHWHKFAAVAVRHTIFLSHATTLGWAPHEIEDALRRNVGVTQTEILYRCECGKVKTETIDGKWTMEQIGKSERVSHGT